LIPHDFRSAPQRELGHKLRIMSRAPDRSQRPRTARAVAHELIGAVLRSHRPLDELLAAHPGLAALSPRDRGFARKLVGTVLRRLGQIDRLIADCLERPLPRRGAPAMDALRLGAAQLLFLGTPAHAAVDSTVQLLSHGVAGYRGLVNAVLRRLDREGGERLAALPPVPINTPAWLYEGWVGAYGPATAAAIATAHLEEPPLDLSVKSAPGDWAARLGATLLPTGSLRLEAEGPIEALAGFAEGGWWVQDAAAALPARLFGEVAGRRVIDLCAAPGGKTAMLAAAGAAVVAVDRSPTRLARLRQNLARLGLAAEILEADATQWEPAEPADAVLLDAPCSSTGTIRRHPDLPWIKRPQEMKTLVRLQDRLLAAAARMVRPGGLLVYCTCSLEPAECAERIAAFLADGAPFEAAPIEPGEIGGLAELVTTSGELRSLPCHLADAGGMDGFYAARLRRR
jgi:16S rRNA (cytosine967-C5)-methyltransferase